MTATEYVDRTDAQFQEMAALAKEFADMAKQAIAERNALREQVKALREALDIATSAMSTGLWDASAFYVASGQYQTDMAQIYALRNSALAQTKESA